MDNNKKSTDVRTKHKRTINTILIILLVFILSCNFIEIFFSMKLHEIFLLKNPEENNSLYLLNNLAKKVSAIYIACIHIYCILFYFAGRGLRRYLIANGHIFIFYLFDIVLNLILQNKSFSLIATNIEYICYGISINLCILIILIFRKIFRKPNPI